MGMGLLTTNPVLLIFRCASAPISDKEVPCEKTANARAVPAIVAPAAAARKALTIGDSNRRSIHFGRRFSVS